VAARLATGFSRNTGFVAHVGLPISVQSASTLALPRTNLHPARPRGADARTVAECVNMLRGRPFVIWTGFGARHAAASIRKLVERSGAAVISSPRGKGIIPEDHPQFVGVTGVGGHTHVETFMAREKPKRVLVLGTRLGEASSYWSRALAPSREFIHVDVDPDAFGTGYQAVRTYAVEAEIECFVDQLLEQWPAEAPVPSFSTPPFSEWTLPERGRSPVRPQALMAAFQRVIVDGSNALVLAESGNSFLWTTNMLRFRTPDRYRTSPGFGAMGHCTCGVVGAALGSGRKAVAVVGDGAVLMQNEISSAVRYKVPAVWVVLNDGLYSICDQGMRSFGWDAFETEIPATDFVMLARAMGADGVRVHREEDLEAALDSALAARGPFVVDVIIDRTEWAPATQRNKSLKAQGI
jgi:acetolactate synthase-1/2/3 large subunit